MIRLCRRKEFFEKSAQSGSETDFISGRKSGKRLPAEYKANGGRYLVLLFVCDSREKGESQGPRPDGFGDGKAQVLRNDFAPGRLPVNGCEIGG